MSVNALVQSVRSYLASNHMFVDNEWLIGCVEYLTEDSSNNLNEGDIQNLAKEQWLLNDLKDICPGSLPPNLKCLQKSVLNGRFVLQINAAIDIGTPAYQQFLKLQKVNMENIEATTKFDDKIPSHRMIKLYLTDGVQEVTAIEYKSMRNLSCDITPGCKMLVKGPIECRRGVLLLTENAIELMGGEVQEIAISNCLAGLLSTKLGFPITQESTLNTTVPQRNASLPTPHAHMPSRTDPEPDPRPVAIVTSLQVANFADDEFDVDQLAAIEAEINPPPNTGKRPSTTDNGKPEKRLKIDVRNTVDDYPDEEDMFFEDDDYLREIEAKFDETERETNKFPVAVSSEPYVYIKQINEMNEASRAGGVFRVKAQIMKLLSKLSVGKDGWSLKCTIVDGTGSIDVEFTSAVLSKLVGFTPQEMNQLKKQMAAKPELKDIAVSALQKAKDTLQVLYCIIELTMLEVPKITSLNPFEDCHVASQKSRLQNCRL